MDRMAEGFPHLLRAHRTHHKWSQESLALSAEVSPRHLSCLETGKSQPSREMVLRLAEVLGLALRERNTLLVSAGFAAVYATTPLDDLAMAPLNRAIDLIFTQQEPYGAVLLDRCWNVVRANDGARRLLGAFLDPSAVPMSVATNLLRATVHPAALRPHIVNFDDVAGLVLDRVERAHHAHPMDEELRALLEEIRGYVGTTRPVRSAPSGGAPFAVLHLRRGDDDLRLFTLLTTIGTPIDVTAQDLTLESLFPADEATARWFRSRRPTDRAG